MPEWEAEQRLHESIRVLQDVCHWPYRTDGDTLAPDRTQPGGSPKFSYDLFKRALNAADAAAREFGIAQDQAPIDSQGIRAVG